MLFFGEKLRLHSICISYFLSYMLSKFAFISENCFYVKYHFVSHIISVSLNKTSFPMQFEIEDVSYTCLKTNAMQNKSKVYCMYNITYMLNVMVQMAEIIKESLQVSEVMHLDMTTIPPVIVTRGSQNDCCKARNLLLLETRNPFLCHSVCNNAIFLQNIYVLSCFGSL